jgi:hypothetical protein
MVLKIFEKPPNTRSEGYFRLTSSKTKILLLKFPLADGATSSLVTKKWLKKIDLNSLIDNFFYNVIKYGNR